MTKWRAICYLVIGGLTFVLGFQSARFRYAKKIEGLEVRNSSTNQLYERKKGEVARLKARILKADRLDNLQEFLDFDSELVENGILTLVNYPVVPAATQSPYPNNLIICDAKVELTAFPSSNGMIRIAFPAFINRKSHHHAPLSVGDSIQAHLIPEDNVETIDKIFEYSDSSESFDAPLYYLANIRKVSGLPREIVPLEKRLDDTELDPMSENQKRIFDSYNKIGKAESEAQRCRGIIDRAVEESGGLYCTVDERYSFRKTEEFKGWEEALATLRSWNEQLKSEGIQFLVAPVPSKTLVNLPALFTPDELPVMQLYPGRASFYQQALEEGIAIIDLLEPLQHRVEIGGANSPRVFYEGADEHPAAGAIQVIASEVAKHLRQLRPVDPQLHPIELTVPFSIPHQYSGWPENLHQPFSLEAFQIWTKEESGLITVRSSPPSPVLMIGDSFIGVPRTYGVESADLISHLGKELRIKVDGFERGCGAAQMMRHVKAQKGMLAHRKSVIFVFYEPSLIQRKNNERQQWEIADLFTVGDNRKTEATE